jgi:prevent-host-death family protein
MKTATITGAKNRLSALIDQVRAGESILITDRGTPVARLEPVAALPDAEGRLARLERAGIIRRGSAPVPLEMLKKPGPKLPPGVSIVDVLLEERRQGR